MTSRSSSRNGRRTALSISFPIVLKAGSTAVGGICSACTATRWLHPRRSNRSGHWLPSSAGRSGISGMSTFAFVSAQTLVCSYIQKGVQKLSTVDLGIVRRAAGPDRVSGHILRPRRWRKGLFPRRLAERTAGDRRARSRIRPHDGFAAIDHPGCRSLSQLSLCAAAGRVSTPITDSRPMGCSIRHETRISRRPRVNCRRSSCIATAGRRPPPRRH